MMQNNLISRPFDSLVMLTWSNWFTELRSNRYHYASRFAKLVPVIFVQPDLKEKSYSFEQTELANVIILHLYHDYNDLQGELLNQALLEAGCLNPILWIYNGYFSNVISRYSVLNVFHGTEDYFASDSRLKIEDKKLRNSFNNVLEECQLLISVSDGVTNSFKEHSKFREKFITITNGCDYKFYAPPATDGFLNPEQDIVFYQGNIFDKIDYDMLIEVAKRLPDWQFLFCGRVLFNDKEWQELCELPNVNYLGLLKAEQIREYSYKATVGIIPFVESEWLIERSLPLKTFEYLACALPVVSVPIKSILQYEDVIQFASGAEQFGQAIINAKALRNNSEHLSLCLSVAASQDYDNKFTTVENEICSFINELRDKNEKNSLNIAIFYDPEYLCQSEDILMAINQYSQHRIFFIPQNTGSERGLSLFDVIINCSNNKIMDLNEDLMGKFKRFGGYKVLLACNNPAYNQEDLARIKQCGFHLVYMWGVEQNASTNYQQDFTNLLVSNDKAALQDNVAKLDVFLARQVNVPYNKKHLISTLSVIRDNDEYILEYDPLNFLNLPSTQPHHPQAFLIKKKLVLNLTTCQLYSAIFQIYKKWIVKKIHGMYKFLPAFIKKPIAFFIPGGVKQILISKMQS